MQCITLHDRGKEDVVHTDVVLVIVAERQLIVGCIGAVVCGIRIVHLQKSKQIQGRLLLPVLSIMLPKLRNVHPIMSPCEVQRQEGGEGQVEQLFHGVQR